MNVVKAPILRRVFSVLAVVNALAAPVEQKRLSSRADYQRYIDPLLRVQDFGIHYYDDGAADATVLFPLSAAHTYDKPPDPVATLVRLGVKSFPLLIDCLNDGRVTNAEFSGNAITRPMKVPVGYVCLDILMGTTMGRPVSNPDCADDGLGACMTYGFYFRPDDYYHCVERVLSCDVRPWVKVV